MTEPKCVLLIVTGGIAAYKAADVASKLAQAGAGVSVVMTRSARKFIGPTTFEALTGRPVYSRTFAPKEHFIGEHIGLARRAELMIVAPASANYMARVAHGLADDLVVAPYATALALAVAPVGWAPLAVLAGMGLHLGMEVPNWPPDNIEDLAKRFEDQY